MRNELGCSISELGLRAIPQMKCICINAHSMGKKQELKVIVRHENCDMVTITEMWYDHSCNWSAAMEGYKLFRRGRQGRIGIGVALYVRECFDVAELSAGNDKFESVWVRIREKPTRLTCW